MGIHSSYWSGSGAVAGGSHSVKNVYVTLSSVCEIKHVWPIFALMLALHPCLGKKKAKEDEWESMTEQVHNLNEGPGEQSFSWLFQVLNALLGFCLLTDKQLLLSFLAEASDSGKGNVTADCIPIEG